MASDHQPLSPHLGIYRWQLTSVLSILHRISGIALVVGAVLLVSWFGSAADGPASFAGFQGFLGSPIGIPMLFGCSAALFYHLCNGIRHLWWDTGRGLELKSVYATGWTVLIATVVLTFIVWGIGDVVHSRQSYLGSQGRQPNHRGRRLPGRLSTRAKPGLRQTSAGTRCLHRA